MIDEAHSNEGDFERLMKMDEEWPDHFEERSHGSRGEIEEAGERKTRRHGQHGRPAAVAAGLSARPVGLVRPRARACGRWPTGSSTISTPTATCRAGWRTCWAPTPARTRSALAQRALALVQKLDPPGVGARDLRECLLLQLVPGVPHYEQLRTLIANHLEDLEHNRLPVISRKTGYSIELIQEVLGELRKLNPKPGADFNNVAVPPVTPDVFVELDEDGQYRVRLEEGDTPSLFISPYYRKLFQEPGHHRRNPRVHQAEDQLGAVADRFDRAAPQHAD